MKTEIYAELKGNGKQQPVFEGVQVQAELRETLAITTITQSYRNAGRKNIEAVYTFPLPLDAVLLEMTVTLGDKTLKGTVLPKKEAEEKYEEAIIEGDAPVMLENPQPGLYTMNVGNLQPGDKASITISYGMFMYWQGQSLRYHLPTTIAPRYGSAEKAGMEPRQEPETSIAADNICTFEMKIAGGLSKGVVESPSHSIVVERASDYSDCMVKLSQNSAFMDRDLIIRINREEQQGVSLAIERDGDEYLLWGSFQPLLGLPDNSSPRSVKIVVDCSGSMAGDSIAQAREALLRVMDELRPQDWFNIVAFGSNATPLFNSQVQASTESLAFARGFLKKLDADMGGTEIGKALDMAIRLKCREDIRQDVLLITDGEIWEWERIVKKTQKSGHRFFTIGVGSAVSEAFVKSLAERTGGACELVSPNEKMAERIHRHFQRLATPFCTGVTLSWPVKPGRIYPEKLTNIFDGDTRNIFAWFKERPEGKVEMRLTLPDGTERSLGAEIAASENEGSQDGSISRMVAALRLKGMEDEKMATELAVRYQLASRFTNYLAIVVREEGKKAEELPELHKIQQMLAAGWGGTGTALYSAAEPFEAFGMPCFLRAHAPIPSAPPLCGNNFCFCDELAEAPADYDVNDSSALLWIWDVIEPDEMERFIGVLDEVLCTGLMPTNINLPLMPLSITDLLFGILGEGVASEQEIVSLFLHILAGSTAGESWFSRQSKRVIEKGYRQLNPDNATEELVRERLILRHEKKQKNSLIGSISRKLFGKIGKAS